MAKKKGAGLLLAIVAGVGVLALVSDSKASGKCEWEDALPEADKALLTEVMMYSGAGGGSLTDPAKLATLRAKVAELKAKGFPKAATCLDILVTDLANRPQTAQPPKVL